MCFRKIITLGARYFGGGGVADEKKVIWDMIFEIEISRYSAKLINFVK